MTGVAKLIATGGVMQEQTGSADGRISPRRRGIRQGGLLMLLTLFLVPLLAVATEYFSLDEAVLATVALIGFWGGLIRILYAAIFQSRLPSETHPALTDPPRSSELGGPHGRPALSPAQSGTAADRVVAAAQSKFETGDLVPASVTEPTTKLLKTNDE